MNSVINSSSYQDPSGGIESWAVHWHGRCDCKDHSPRRFFTRFQYVCVNEWVDQVASETVST
jgi:hypothetical protein